MKPLPPVRSTRVILEVGWYELIIRGMEKINGDILTLPSAQATATLMDKWQNGIASLRLLLYLSPVLGLQCLTASCLFRKCCDSRSPTSIISLMPDIMLHC